MSEHTITTIDDATPSAAPTAAPAAAAPTETPPAEAGRQRYIIRHYRLDNVQDEPTLFKERVSEYLDSIYGESEQGERLICRFPGEDHTLEIYHCRTPMHMLAMLTMLYATEDDQKQLSVEQLAERGLSYSQREEQKL